jgi:hypothetical protein
MNIQQLFAKDLMRNINGVIKAEQIDASSIFSELDEYVVTNELEKHFSVFLKIMQMQLNNLLEPIPIKWVYGFQDSLVQVNHII